MLFARLRQSTYSFTHIAPRGIHAVKRSGVVSAVWATLVGNMAV